MSVFRLYQDAFLSRYGNTFTETVIELGCERHYQHNQFFPNVVRFKCTNVARDFDEYLDVTDMSAVEDNSQSAYLCVSVLEHIDDIFAAISEIERTLRPGGRLLITVPFMFPIHDEVDYWRLSKSFFEQYLMSFQFEVFVHFGGKLSSVANLLQRPKRKLGPRFLVYKLIGFLALILAKHFDCIDDAPVGFGLIAIKQQDKEASKNE